MFSNLLKSTLAVAALTIAPAAFANAPILVTSNADTGAGTLRAALDEAAKMDGAQIVIVTKDDIEIASTLAYAGTAPVEIFGAGQTVKTAENVTLLAATEGADLTVADLTFEGPGGFTIENRGDLDGPAGKGIFVDLRDDQTGTVTLTLTNVTVKGVANHGIHVSDCSLADDCGGGGGGAGEGSPASIAVVLTNVVVDDAGYGKFDADGLRVDERAEGDITLIAAGSLFTKVGADGVELDEGQVGSVFATITDTRFIENGGYCVPSIMEPFIPEEDEGEFEDNVRAEADIPMITGTPDNTCIERAVDLYDSGFVEEFEFALDLDDGIDLDEAGEGGLVVTMIDSVISDNLDEGVDFDEEGAGDIIVNFIRNTATGNTDDGYKMSEEDDGAVLGTVVASKAETNGGKGFVFEEEGAGDLVVRAFEAMTAKNDDMDKTGFEVVQDDEGTGLLVLTASDITDGIDDEGVTVETK